MWSLIPPSYWEDSDFVYIGFRNARRSLKLFTVRLNALDVNFTYVEARTKQRTVAY